MCTFNRGGVEIGSRNGMNFTYAGGTPTEEEMKEIETFSPLIQAITGIYVFVVLRPKERTRGNDADMMYTHQIDVSAASLHEHMREIIDGCWAVADEDDHKIQMTRKHLKPLVEFVKENPGHLEENQLWVVFEVWAALAINYKNLKILVDLGVPELCAKYWSMDPENPFRSGIAIVFNQICLTISNEVRNRFEVSDPDLKKKTKSTNQYLHKFFQKCGYNVMKSIVEGLRHTAIKNCTLYIIRGMAELAQFPTFMQCCIQDPEIFTPLRKYIQKLPAILLKTKKLDEDDKGYEDYGNIIACWGRLIEIFLHISRPCDWSIFEQNPEANKKVNQYVKEGICPTIFQLLQIAVQTHHGLLQTILEFTVHLSRSEAVRRILFGYPGAADFFCDLVSGRSKCNDELMKDNRKTLGAAFLTMAHFLWDKYWGDKLAEYEIIEDNAYSTFTLEQLKWVTGLDKDVMETEQFFQITTFEGRVLLMILPSVRHPDIAEQFLEHGVVPLCIKHMDCYNNDCPVAAMKCLQYLLLHQFSKTHPDFHWKRDQFKKVICLKPRDSRLQPLEHGQRVDICRKQLLHSLAMIDESIEEFIEFCEENKGHPVADYFLNCNQEEIAKVFNHPERNYADLRQCANISSIIRQCSNCSKKETKKEQFKKCAACRSVLYCSKVCQKADWKAHKNDCAKRAKNETSRPKQTKSNK